MVIVLAEVRVAQENRAALTELAETLAAATRKEPGCLQYDLCVDFADPDKVHLVETWKDRAALDAHFMTPHMAAFQKAAGPLMTDAAKVRIVTPEKIEAL